MQGYLRLKVGIHEAQHPHLHRRKQIVLRVVLLRHRRLPRLLHANHAGAPLPERRLHEADECGHLGAQHQHPKHPVQLHVKHAAHAGQPRLLVGALKVPNAVLQQLPHAHAAVVHGGVLGVGRDVDNVKLALREAEVPRDKVSVQLHVLRNHLHAAEPVALHLLHKRLRRRKRRPVAPQAQARHVAKVPRLRRGRGGDVHDARARAALLQRVHGGGRRGGPGRRAPPLVADGHVLRHVALVQDHDAVVVRGQPLEHRGRVPGEEGVGRKHDVRGRRATRGRLQKLLGADAEEPPGANLGELALRRRHEVHVGADPQAGRCPLVAEHVAEHVAEDDRACRARLADARAVAEQEPAALAGGHDGAVLLEAQRDRQQLVPREVRQHRLPREEELGAGRGERHQRERGGLDDGGGRGLEEVVVEGAGLERHQPYLGLLLHAVLGVVVLVGHVGRGLLTLLAAAGRDGVGDGSRRRTRSRRRASRGRSGVGDGSRRRTRSRRRASRGRSGVGDESRRRTKSRRRASRSRRGVGNKSRRRTRSRRRASRGMARHLVVHVHLDVLPKLAGGVSHALPVLVPRLQRLVVNAHDLQELVLVRYGLADALDPLFRVRKERGIARGRRGAGTGHYGAWRGVLRHDHRFACHGILHHGRRRHDRQFPLHGHDIVVVVVHHHHHITLQDRRRPRRIQQAQHPALVVVVHARQVHDAALRHACHVESSAAPGSPDKLSTTANAVVPQITPVQKHIQNLFP